MTNKIKKTIRLGAAIVALAIIASSQNSNANEYDRVFANEQPQVIYVPVAVPIATSTPYSYQDSFPVHVPVEQPKQERDWQAQADLAI